MIKLTISRKILPQNLGFLVTKSTKIYRYIFSQNNIQENALILSLILFLSAYVFRQRKINFSCCFLVLSYFMRKKLILVVIF